MVLLLLFYSNHVHILLFLYTFIHVSYLIIVFLLTLVLIAAYDPVLRIVFYTLVIYSIHIFRIYLHCSLL